MSRSRNAGAQRAGASQSRTSGADLLRSWLQHHRRSARESLQRLLANPFASLLSGMVIGIALALPVGMMVALENARSVSSGWDHRAQVSLFLRPEMTDQVAAELEKTLLERADISGTRLVVRGEALQEFQQLSGLGDVLRHLEENPLPNLIILTPAAEQLDAEQASRLQADLSALPGVDRAVLDMAWVQRLNSLMELGQRMVLAVGVLFAVGVLLVVGNTIRLAIESRRDEILIVKLVGGSDAFVRRPFLYTGIWYGLTGALVAWFILSLSLWWLQAPLATLAMLYQSGFQLQGLGASGALQLIGLGGCLGFCGAWLAVSRHLKAIQPH
jgi:cell division transport system permease protein